jgi:hypothetical protein
MENDNEYAYKLSSVTVNWSKQEDKLKFAKKWYHQEKNTANFIGQVKESLKLIL